MVLTRKRAAGGSVSGTDHGSTESPHPTKTGLTTSAQDAGSDAGGATHETENKTNAKSSLPSLPAEPPSKQRKPSSELASVSIADRANVSVHPAEQAAVTAALSSDRDIADQVSCRAQSSSSVIPQLVAVSAAGDGLAGTPTERMPFSGAGAFSVSQFETVSVAPDSSGSAVEPGGEQQQQKRKKQVRVMSRHLPPRSGAVATNQQQQQFASSKSTVSIGLTSLFSPKAQTISAVSTTSITSVTLPIVTNTVPPVQSTYSLKASSPYTSVVSASAVAAGPHQVVVSRSLTGGKSLLAAGSVRPAFKSAASYLVSPTPQRITFSPGSPGLTTLIGSDGSSSSASLATPVTRPSASVINTIPLFPIPASELAVSSTQTAMLPTAHTAVVPATQTIMVPATQTVVAIQTAVAPPTQTVVVPASQTMVVPAVQTVAVPSSAVHAPNISTPPIQPTMVFAPQQALILPAKPAATFSPSVLITSPSSSTMGGAGSTFKTSHAASSSSSSSNSAAPRESTSVSALSAKLEEGETSMTWDKESTLTLIRLYKEHKAYFEDHHYKKKSVWELIATKMRQGRKDAPRFRWNHVENKWKNMTKKYRDCVDMNRRNDTQSKCSFHDEIAAVYNYNQDDNHKTAVVEGHDPLNNAVQGSIVINGYPSGGSAALSAAPTTVMMPTKVERPSVDEGVSVVNSDSRSAELQTVLVKKKKYARLDLPAATTTLHSGPSHKPILHHLTAAPAHPEPPSPRPTSDSAPDVVTLLRQLKEDRDQRDQVRMDRLEAMHVEKMKMFGQFLDIIKQLKPS